MLHHEVYGRPPSPQAKHLQIFLAGDTEKEGVRCRERAQSNRSSPLFAKGTEIRYHVHDLGSILNSSYGYMIYHSKVEISQLCCKKM